MNASHPELVSGARRAALLGAILWLGGAGRAQAAADLAPGDSVTLDAARQALESGRAMLIDVREPDEHRRGVAPGARLLPMSELRQRLGEIPVDPAQPVLLICNTQNRSSSVLRALRSRGYGHVRYVEGGMSEWVRRGWPLVTPRP